MRIGIDAHMLGDHSGGNESFYSNILKQMRKNENDEIYLFVKKDIDISEFPEFFKIVHYKQAGAFTRNFIELPKLCKKYRLDLLHTQYFIPFANPCKTVCTIHDICFEHYKNIFTKKEYFRQKILIPYAAKHSAFIYTVSNHAKKDITGHYHVPEEKVIVAYNAVDSMFRKLDIAELEEEALRNKFNIGSSDYVLSVGNLQPRKNIPTLIRAFLSYKERSKTNCRLVIVGKKAWMYSDIIQESLNNSDSIIFTDYVTTFDLVRLYNAAKCFVYPSFFEGFGIPPLEAMACGTPVAVANATSLPEVAGDAGIYFDPFNEKEMENTIGKLMENKALRDELIEKGRKQVEKFSWKKSAQLIYDTYSRV